MNDRFVVDNGVVWLYQNGVQAVRLTPKATANLLNDLDKLHAENKRLCTTLKALEGDLDMDMDFTQHVSAQTGIPTKMLTGKNVKAGVGYFIGQRVILNDEEIGTIQAAENKHRIDEMPNTDKHVWVFSPSREYASHYATHNIKPLPNGQL